MLPDYVIGLGANLGPRLQTLRQACAALDALPDCRVLARSPVYESPPLGPPQPHYLNAAVRLHCKRGPASLLEDLLAIERAHGRERRERWGPRTLDLDILEGPVHLSSAQLTVPHPGLVERWFALFPLLDVAPELTERYADACAALPAPLPPIGDAL